MIEYIAMQEEHCEAVAALAKTYLPESWSLSGIQDVLRYKDNVYYVVKEKQQIIAFAGIMVVCDDAELLNIVVSEQYRNKGIAGSLIDCLCRDAVDRGAQRMLLEVRKANKAARCLYEKKGFTSIGERKRYYSNPVDDAIIMECVLSGQVCSHREDVILERKRG